MKKELAFAGAFIAILAVAAFSTFQSMEAELLPTSPSEYATPYDTLPNGTIIDVDCVCTESCRCMCCYWNGDQRVSCGLEGKCSPRNPRSDCRINPDGEKCIAGDEDC